jgi:rare lipoprotein A
LPLGTVVRITNPENGRSVKVRINDRGPYVAGRALDLSRQAAKKLGTIHQGIARVRITRLRRNGTLEESNASSNAGSEKPVQTADVGRGS